MPERLSLFGHPVHPILIVVPLGLLPFSVFLDLIYLATDNEVWADRAFIVLIAGVLGGLTAAVFGVLDWISFPRESEAWSVGLRHAISNDLALLLFIVSIILRWMEDDRTSTWAIVASLVALPILMFGGWLGGELVYRLGVRVDVGARSRTTSERPGP